MHLNFFWQARFYDRIIRNEKEFEKISEYLKHNPQEWERDCYFDNSDLKEQKTLIICILG